LDFANKSNNFRGFALVDGEQTAVIYIFGVIEFLIWCSFWGREKYQLQGLSIILNDPLNDADASAFPRHLSSPLITIGNWFYHA